MIYCISLMRVEFQSATFFNRKKVHVDARSGDSFFLQQFKPFSAATTNIEDTVTDTGSIENRQVHLERIFNVGARSPELIFKREIKQIHEVIRRIDLWCPAGNVRHGQRLAPFEQR